MVNELSDFTGNDKQQEMESEKSGGIKRKADEIVTGTAKRQNVESTSEKLVDKHKCDFESESDKVKCDEEWCKLKLCKLLTQTTHSELEELARKAVLFASQTPPDKSDCEQSEKPEPLVLGSFGSRDERTLLHRCVRYRFPQLKTITTPNTPIVSAQICPNYSKFCDVIGQSLANDLLRFILVESAECAKGAITITGDFSKERRRQLHHLIASCYGKFMEARTCPPIKDDELSRITIRPKKKRSEKKDVDVPGSILAFTLWKKNTETYTAIQEIASHLRLQPHLLNFAGIKDKRAVTTQRCTVCGISENKLRLLSQSLPKRLRISDIYSVSRVIHLGELKGNHFDIRLTDVRLLDEDMCEHAKITLRNVVDSQMRTVEETGFVNYFGPQRFGRQVFSALNSTNDDCTPSIEGPAIGLAMLQGHFEKAVKILLNPAENLPQNQINDVEKAKLHFQATGDILGTLKVMPKHKLREISILKTLHRCGSTDQYAFTKALMSLPHSSRLLYVHSFCSWVWNKMASERMRVHGLKPVVGDLAISKHEKDETNSGTVNANKEKVFVVTQDDIISGRVGSEDVVLTVPGNQVCYPPILEEEYRKILKVLETPGNKGSGEKSFRIPDLKLNAPGVYRQLIAFPRNLTWRYVSAFESTTTMERHTPSQNGNLDVKKATEGESYNDDTVACMLSVTAPLTQSTADDPSHPSACCSNFAGVAASLRYDVELAFDLRPSCYATTFLQEVTNGHLR